MSSLKYPMKEWMEMNETHIGITGCASMTNQYFGSTRFKMAATESLAKPLQLCRFRDYLKFGAVVVNRRG